MDPGRFDTWVRSLVATPTRRGLLRLMTGTTLGGALALLGAGGLADHGCRHPGADCARDGQCCSGRCSDRGRCLCTRAAQCPEPRNPCQKAVCTDAGRCTVGDRRAGAPCVAGDGCTDGDACDGSGECVPGTPRDCPDGETCQGGACAAPSGTPARGDGSAPPASPATTDSGEWVPGTPLACSPGLHRCGDGCVVRDDPAHCPRGWELAFGDGFDGDALDRSRWATRYPWGRSRVACCGELQWYSDAEGPGGNYHVHDGVLSLVARRENEPIEGEGHEHPYTSGLISSHASFAQEHGYFEVRARVPAGRGLWPAFWLLPADGARPWEIDVVELLGHEPGTVHLTVHYPNAEGRHDTIAADFTGPDFSRGYHTFAVEWGPERIVWYVDGVERHRVEQARAIPSGPFYLIANLAVGGAWPGAPDGTTAFPAAFDIDHVRVYRRA